MRICTAFAVALLLIFSTLSAQVKGPETPLIRANAGEVLLDVVVRDKKGNAVKNLESGDFTVFDNGVRRPITSFRLVQGSDAIVGDATANGGAPAHKPLNPLQQIRLVTLIFNRLDLNARQLARTAALDLLKNELPQNVYAAVLVLGENLQAIQAFTNDRELLRKAIERATSGQYSEFVSDSARIEDQMKQLLGPATAGESIGEQLDGAGTGGGGSGAGGAPDAGLSADKAMAQMLYNTLLLTRSTELAQTGRAAIFGLLDALREQYRLPGRKSVLFFSSGFGVPQGMEEPFRTVISTANRYNVTFYSIDAGGLSTKSQNQEAVSELRDATSASRANFRKGNGLVTPAMANALDTAINAGKANTQDTLAELAESTGGFLIANTNDFRDPLRKVTEDLETYYELTYNPGIEKYDGSFRKIEVKTDRSNLRLQSRAGYFALPSVGSQGPILAPYELPLLQALEAKPTPKPFAFQSSGLHFRGPNDESICSLLIDIPLTNMKMAEVKASAGKANEDKAVEKFQGELAYVAMVKDARGEVVRKFNNEVPLAATAAQMNDFRASHFINSEQFELLPGRYTLETAVLDRQSNLASVRKSAFFMPAADSAHLGISSVGIVRSVRDKSESDTAADPFVMSGKLVTPTLNPVYKKAPGQTMSFFVAIYPKAEDSAKPELAMEFIRDGQVLGKLAPALSEPDADHRIYYIATAPTEKLEPGFYQIRFVVHQGAQSAEESVTFTLE